MALSPEEKPIAVIREQETLLVKAKATGVVLLATIGAAILAGIVAMLRQRPPALLRQATRIADTRQWDRVERVENRAFYRWLSEGELLFFRTDPLGQSKAVRRDVHTGTETLVADYNPFVLVLSSPNGRLRLQQTLGSRDYSTSTARGSDKILWDGPKEQGPHDTFWLPDSRGWVKIHRGNREPPLFGHPEVLLYRLDKVKTTTQRKQSPTQKVQQPERAGDHVKPPWLLGLTPTVTGIAGVTILPTLRALRRPDSPQIHIQYTTGFGGDHGGMASFQTGSFDYIEWDLLVPNGPVRRRPLQSPPGIARAFVALSPRGDRLAWMAQSRNVPPPLEWLHTRFPFLRIPMTHIATLWITKPDGTQPRLLGSERIRPGQAPPGPIRWTPEGKRISFVYQDTLWAVPVD